MKYIFYYLKKYLSLKITYKKNNSFSSYRYINLDKVIDLII